MNTTRSYYEEEGLSRDRYGDEEFWSRKYHLGRMKRIRKILKATITKSHTFVDIGCGTGEYLALAKSQAKFVVGIDISSTYLERARNLLGNSAHLVLGSAECLPFRDSCFNVVLCTEVLEHLQDMDRACDELFRTSSEIIIVTMPVCSLMRRVSRLVPRMAKWLNGADRRVGHINILYLRRILDKFKREGWHVSAVTFWSYSGLMKSLRLPIFFSPLVDAIQSWLDLVLPYSGNAAIILCHRKKSETA